MYPVINKLNWFLIPSMKLVPNKTCLLNITAKIKKLINIYSTRNLNTFLLWKPSVFNSGRTAATSGLFIVH